MQQGAPSGWTGSAHTLLIPCMMWSVTVIPLLHLEERESGAGVLSQSQVLLAFGVVAELFNGVRDAEPLDGEFQQCLILTSTSLGDPI